MLSTLCSCGSGTPSVSPSPSPAQDSQQPPANTPEGMDNDTVTNDPSQGDSGDYTDNINWWGRYNCGGFYLDITNFNGERFSFSFTYFSLDDFDYMDQLEGVAAVWPNEAYNAEYANIIFSINAESETIYVTVDGDEWSYLAGEYMQDYGTIQQGNYDDESEWLGIYRNFDNNVAFEISQMSGSEFWVDILKFTDADAFEYFEEDKELMDITRNLDFEIVTYGWAEIDGDNPNFATLNKIGLSMLEDYEGIDLFLNESDELAYLHGRYVKFS